MNVLPDILPWLAAMLVLIAGSAFFSASEAAFFYLRWTDRRAMQDGGPAQQIAAGLLADPDRLLSAVLFWNLVVNISYFALVSIVAIQLEKHPHAGQSTAVAFSFGALLAIIFFSEMLPKSLAVLSARWLAAALGIPLAVCVRAVDPLMPALRTVNLLSRRLIWPKFTREAYLEVADLERAIELSTSDAQLVEQEQAVLRNIVALSDIRADEWMRPRTQFRTFRPPVSLADLEGQMTPSGYLLVTEPDSDEVAAAVHLPSLSDVPQNRLDHYAEPVVYVPWCTTVAAALEEMQRRDRDVAAVVNEFGETIGILTFDDILDSVFTFNPSRIGRLIDRPPIEQIRPGTWHVAGMTGLRRLSRDLGVGLPPSRNHTVAGILQETLERVAATGDQCDWGPFHLRVVDAPECGHLLVELRLIGEEEQRP